MSVMRGPKSPPTPTLLPKCATGISGLDEVTYGGLPRGRTTLICGGPGCGKTLFGMEFLVRGATQFDEPGVCLSFEETAEELTANASSLGFDVNRLIARKKLAIDYIFLERSQIEETGDYDLEGLFLRLDLAVQSIGAKRVLIDSVESLLSGLSNESILRAELRRLFRWLKDRDLTAVVTGERGEGALTRHGLEEYISDCVILLDHRVSEGVFTRRMRVVKYRGSFHGTNEYPFLIDSDGISVLPVTSLELKHSVSSRRVSTGITSLDEMLGGEGYFKGSSILISGTAGTGKTSLACNFVAAACARGERCVYFSYEESPDQIARNMRSIGLNIQRWMDAGLLTIQAARPTQFGLEMHLVNIHKVITNFNPSIVVIDPATALLSAGANVETRSMLLRIIDFLKGRSITAVLTTLTGGGEALEQSQVEISSVIDTWILLRDIESGGERNRGIFVLKARGLSHSNQIREFLLSDKGVELREVYIGGAGLLTGSARVAQESADKSDLLRARQELEMRQSVITRERSAVKAQIAMLQSELVMKEQEAEQLISQAEMLSQKKEQHRAEIARSRAVRPQSTVDQRSRRRGKKTGGKR